MEIKIGNASDFVWFDFPRSLYREKTEAPYEWNIVSAKVTSGAWEGRKIQMNLTTNEITGFLQALAITISPLKGAASLESLEDWIHLQLKVDDTGKIEIQGKAKDSDLGNKLNFRIQTDQSFFNQMPKQIEDYLSSQRDK